MKSMKVRWLAFLELFKRQPKFEAQKLNLVDALRLAAILSKYIDTKDIEKDSQPLDFIAALVNKLTPKDYLHCVKLLSGEHRDEEYKAYSSLKILSVFIEGLKQNQVLSLISFYNSLGIS